MTQPIDPAATAPANPAPVPATSSVDTTTNQLATTIQSMIDAALAGVPKDIKGVITATNPTNSPPDVSLTLSGDTTVIANVRYVDAYSPVVGDTVLVSKQGSDIYVIGQLNNSGTGAANGWNAMPTLGGGFSAATQTPQYRLIVDNGDLKIQLRGRINISGTPTAVCTMPAGFRPALIRVASAATDSAPANLAFNTDGTVVLDVTTGGGTITGTSDSNNFDHTHDVPSSHTHSHNNVSNTTASFTDTISLGESTTHTHTAGTFSSPAITAPTWVSLDAVEFFL